MFESGEMPRQLKRDALHMLVLALVFAAFFQLSKHVPAWAQVNPFAEDPYDAIGSFAIQLAIFLAGLSCVRAFRTRDTDASGAEQALVARGNLLCAGAVLLTFGGDAIALARHSGIWIHSTAGQSLCAVLGVLIIWATLAMVELRNSARRLGLLSPSDRVVTAVAAATAAAAVLLVYPEQWREGMAGAILTVVAGMILLFLPLRALALVIPVDTNSLTCDALDDLVALVSSGHKRQNSRAQSPAQKLLPAVAEWIRRSWWLFVVATGAGIGMFLASRELGPVATASRRLILVASVYVGLEGSAVLLGALLLSRPLELIHRREMITRYARSSPREADH
jgi:hypothetical protein